MGEFSCEWNLKATHFLLAVSQLKTEPIMVDPSVFSSILHTSILNELMQPLFISGTLAKLLFDKPDHALEILRGFGWRDFPILPSKSMRERFKLYDYNEKYVADWMQQSYKISKVPEVRTIVLDELSFLLEHSSLLMRTTRTLRHFRKLGIGILDFTGSAYHAKHHALEPLKGARWYLALSVAAAGVVVNSPIVALGGVIIVAFDP
jgi:hypothetical protein